MAIGPRIEKQILLWNKPQALSMHLKVNNDNCTFKSNVARCFASTSYKPVPCLNRVQ